MIQFPYAIASVAIVPLRSDPSHRAEQVSQLLFGECADIIRCESDWVLIKCLSDGYQGWCNNSQIDTLAHVPTSKSRITSPLSIIQNNRNGAQIAVPMGSILYDYESKSKQFTVSTSSYTLLQGACNNTAPAPIATAQRLLGAPYLWGGRTAMGIDCSGFSQLVYSQHDISLPRDAKDQALIGTPIESLNDAKEGDLAFFVNSKQNITHVGILLNPTNIIHASGSVRIDRIDTEGIWREEISAYSHTLHSIIRL